MNTWLFAFIWLGQIHATTPKLTKDECAEMMKVLGSVQAPVCINTAHPAERIYRPGDRRKGGAR